MNVQLNIELTVIVVQAITIIFLVGGYVFKVKSIQEELTEHKDEHLADNLLSRVSKIEGKMNGKLNGGK